MKKRLPLALLLLTQAAFLAAGPPSAGPGAPRMVKFPRKTFSLPRYTPTPTLTRTPASLPGWPMFKGDAQRSGRGPALGLPVQVAWRVKLKGSLYSSPAISEGVVVLGSSAKRAYGLDLATGKQRWMAELPDRVWGSGVAVDHGRAYVGCVDGCVYGLNLQDGAVVGSYCAQRKSPLGNAPDVLSSPLVHNGRLFFGADNHDIYGWDLGGKRDLWRFVAGDILHDNSAAACGGKVLFPGRDAKLYALDPEDGSLKWAYSAPLGFNTVPACDGQRAYLGNADGKMRAIDLATGKEAWSFEASKSKGIMSSPALDGNGGLVFGSSDDHVYCLDAATGALRWKFRTGDVVIASPVITGGLVWVGSYDDKLYALDLASGREAYSIELDGGVFTSAAVAGDRIVVAGRSGDLVCLRATRP